MNAKALAILLLLTVLLSGCTDEAKLDRLQAKFDVLGQILQKQDELHNAATPTVCFLTDINRNQEICILGTARPISIGETIIVGDDLWHVEAVKHYTREAPEHLRGAETKKLYVISQTELLVTFQGKGKKEASPQ